jgi:sarcosine oxidase
MRWAADAGAELRLDVEVTGWSATVDGVRVTTTRGTLDAGALVLAPGRWAPGLLGGFELPLTVERRVQHWFRPVAAGDFAPGCLPVWIWDLADGTSLYGTPSVGTDGAVKAAVHFSAARPADAWAPAEIAEQLAVLLPGLGAEHVRSAECWYTLTPDEHFVVGRHPAADRVLLVCGFSGHGFKFTPVLGEVVADLVTEGATAYDLSLFDPRRFAG